MIHPDITVYVKPSGCQQCIATKFVLDRAGIEYATVDITRDARALEFITDTLGFQQAPVVVLHGRTVDDQDGAPITSWSGLRPDLLEQLTEAA